MERILNFNKIFLLIVTLIHLSHSQETITKCLLNDTDCLTKEASKFLQVLVKGIPELGISKMDKLPIDPVLVTADNFFINWTDLTAVGLNDVVFDNVSINMELKIMRILFHTDILLEFYSILDGVLLSTMPVFGSGKGSLNLKNLQMELLFLFDIIKDKNGKDIMDLKSFYFGYTVDSALANLENLYNGDKKKSAVFHKLCNGSWRIMMNNFSKFFQSKISSKIFNAVKKYMSSQPLEDLALYNN